MSRIYGRVLRWAPAVIWMAAIFYFSSQSDPLAFADPGFNAVIPEGLIHACEYFGLVLLLDFALSSGGKPPLSSAAIRLAPRISLLIALGYAMTDEVHQMFVPERSFQIIDLGYDLIGMAAAWALIRRWAEAHRTVHPRNDEGLG